MEEKNLDLPSKIKRKTSHLHRQHVNEGEDAEDNQTLNAKAQPMLHSEFQPIYEGGGRGFSHSLEQHQLKPQFTLHFSL